MKRIGAVSLIHMLFASAACVLLIQCGKPSVKEWENIEAGFQDPPVSAKPRVWWHWMNGNISMEGIRADLEWMKRTGIGGFQNFDAGLSSPQIVSKRLVYMTPEWKEAFAFATTLADSLGLEMAIAGSPGWSESGGPWVKPEEAMKKYVWSETRVDGGQAFSGKLPQPPATTGSFQNIAGRRGGFGGEPASQDKPQEFYADAAVVAFRLPDKDLSLKELQPRLTSSGGQFNLAGLTDGDLVATTLLPSAKAGEKSWLQFEFTEPQAIQGLTLVTGGGGFRMFGRGGGPSNQTLEASNDGKEFRVIFEIPSGGSSQNTYAFTPVTAKYFRFSVLTPQPQGSPATGAQGIFGGMATPQAGSPGTQIAELVLHTGSRVNRFEDKAGFSAATGLNAQATPEAAPDFVISRDDVVDLTGSMTVDGTLNWTVPEGRWIIMRLGYSLTGATNNPASPEATGLEVDKLSAEHVKSYFTNYLDQYKDATGGLMGSRGLQYIITDSWEAGVANWTDNMILEFNSRNSYDMVSFLPVLAGYVVESADASDRFLWDFRNTLEDLVAENHYDQLTSLLKERGMGRYTESHESGRAFIGDGMEVKRTADVPMSATWVPGGFGGGSGTEVSTGYKADVRESASVAHIYGQNLVAAESMTAGGTAWAYYPGNLKPTADMEMANGLNRFVIHCSVHQPSDTMVPGLTLGPFGQWFTRHETWAEMASPWITYLGRSSFMLQQGKPVADVLYLYGEGGNITALFSQELPAVPEGYNYDFVNADALLHAVSAEKGRILTQGGTSYTLLALDKSTKYMSLPVLQKISELVRKGVVVAGPRPAGTPGLNDDETAFNALADKLWGDGSGMNEVGKGKVFGEQPLSDVLNALGVQPDFSYTGPQDDSQILYVHRQLADGDIYWVNNRRDRYQQVDATFRTTGREAEIWNPETGEITRVSFSMENGKTTVPLNLKPHDAVFVVFRNKTKSPSYVAPGRTETSAGSLEGPWEVSFQKGRGAPDAPVTMDSLVLWNEQADAGIRYFSGVAAYTKTFNAPADWLAGKEVWLDLGQVKNLAEVVLNGRYLGTVWKVPYRLNMTGVLKEGENSLEIRVANLWVNRIIGDLQPGVTDPVSFAAQHSYRADSPLQPSGLLGPLTIVKVTEQ